MCNKFTIRAEKILYLSFSSKFLEYYSLCLKNIFSLKLRLKDSQPFGIMCFKINNTEYLFENSISQNKIICKLLGKNVFKYPVNFYSLDSFVEK